MDQSESSVMTDDAEPPQSLAQLTTEIVSAYVSHNEVAQSDLATLINTVASQLAKIRDKVEPPAEEKARTGGLYAPFDPPGPGRLPGLRQAAQDAEATPGVVQHGLTPGEYRDRFGRMPHYPMVAPNYTQQRRDVALATGLGRPRKPARRGRKAGARPRASEQSRRTGDNAGA